MLRLDNLTHSFGGLQVLGGLSLEIKRGDFIAIVGPSGCGKTTLLNLLSGYVAPTSGKIICEGRARSVYQQNGLFPWLTARENIGLGLRHLKTKAEKNARFAEMLELVGLNGFAEHYPSQLSGGMRQRVELARALAGECEILLLDEPFSSLDYLNALRLRQELARILETAPRAVALVTHNIEEAAQLADRIVVLSERPATIRCVLEVNLARPRSLSHPRVVNAARQVLEVMGLAQKEPDCLISAPRDIAVDEVETAVKANGHYAARLARVVEKQ